MRGYDDFYVVAETEEEAKKAVRELIASAYEPNEIPGRSDAFPTTLELWDETNKMDYSYGMHIVARGLVYSSGS